MKSEWRVAKLGEYITLTTGFPFKSKYYTESKEGIKLLRGDNVVQGNFRWQNVKFWPQNELIDKHKRYWLRDGDVILAMDRPWIEAGLKTGQISEYDLPCLLVQRVSSLRAKENFNQDFLRYLISSRSFVDYVKLIQTGTAVPHISSKQILDFEFWKPPLETQNSIAHILGSLDDKIELNHQMNETLEAIAQALFKSWFVDFDPVIDNAIAAGNEIPDALKAKAEKRRKMRGDRKPLPEAIQKNFPSSFEYNDEIGWIPYGWDTMELSQVTTELRRGISPKYTEIDGVRTINQRCIRNHSIDYSLARRNDEKKRKVDGRILKVGDLLVNSTGVGTLGRMAQVLYLDEPTVTDSHVTVIRSDSEIYKPYTFSRMMLCIEPTIEAMGEGSTGQTELSRANLSKLLIVIPPLNCQELIEDELIDLSNKSFRNAQQQESLTKLRDTLLPKLLSGKLRIPEAEKMINAESEKATGGSGIG